jgi:demethylmenaquinone methyltransferase/2-methoxy-6-polyprenyl-1,4-benzoquinol methylase
MKNKLNPNQYNITDIFENVSRAKYDFMNDIMSFGIHRLWKKYYVDLLHSKFNKKEKILDIASGSGDIFQLFPHDANLYAIDPIDQMHEISKEKNSEKKINYQTGYVESLPYKNNFFQIISCTYGVRNFSNRVKGFSEIYRCLKKNGFFLFMEFGMPNASLIQKPYKIFLDYFLPFSGSIIAKDRHSYKYLAESIKAFPSPITIQKELENIGFFHIETIDFISGANNIYILQKK